VVVVIGAVVMIVIIPIMIAAPAVAIFVPPAMAVLPAVGAGFGKFMAPMFGLGTLPAVVLDGFVQVMVCFSGALLTILGAHGCGACEENCSCEQKGAQYKAYALHFHAPMNYMVQFTSYALA
jgi:hypothetical protein